MWKLILSILIFMSASQLTFAQGDDSDASTKGPDQCARLEAHTVFVADKSIGRHRGTASRLTESHRDAASRGWDFDQLSPYVENGDLQGFFVTYTRPHPCNKR